MTNLLEQAIFFPQRRSGRHYCVPLGRGDRRTFGDFAPGDQTKES